MTFGSFDGTDLDEYLKAKNLKNIVLVGYQPQCTSSPTPHIPHTH